MRYFVELSYKGTQYCGWQRQPNAPTVQETIEDALSTILNTPTSIMGCGRTDTGVHARKFYMHFDYVGDLPKSFQNRLNKFLPTDIAIHRIIEVDAEAHTRFDAFYRAYEYHILFDKNPFHKETAYYYPAGKKLDIEKLNEAAALLLNYEEFFTFCKSESSANTMFCEMKVAKWEVVGDKGLVFHIAANRFLRGMVRLIVGMCLNVALGKISIKEVESALKNQTRLDKSYSVPAEGLYLTEIRYPAEVMN